MSVKGVALGSIAVDCECGGQAHLPPEKFGALYRVPGRETGKLRPTFTADAIGVPCVCGKLYHVTLWVTLSERAAEPLQREEGGT